MFFFPVPETISVNGSPVTGNCSDFVPGITTGGLSRCDDPVSSVLFDGNIPTLTGLDGDMWASQLLTLQTINEFRREIVSEVTDVVARVEFVIFNCPEWGISTQIIRLSTATSVGTRSFPQSFNVPTITSCDSLVRMCIDNIIIQPAIALEFIPPPDSTWTHLAEVTFYSSGSTCPPDTIIPSLPLSDATTDGTTVAMNFATPTTNTTSLLTPSTTS